MKIEIFTILDEIALAYIPPFFQATREVAQRSFMIAVNDRDSTFAKSPKDYTLFHIGTFDDENATVEMLPIKVNLGTGLQFKNLYKESTNEVSNDSLIQPGTES